MEKGKQKGVWAILSTLDIKELKKQGVNYIIATLSCILFALIYEFFSHEVYSGFMIFAFAIPLIFGVAVSFVMYFIKPKKVPKKIENNLYNAGIATLTVGSIIEGVLQIYGTTNWKIYIYLVVGIALIAISLISYIIRRWNFIHLLDYMKSDQ